jgi:hypothetical protein
MQMKRLGERVCVLAGGAAPHQGCSSWASMPVATSQSVAAQRSSACSPPLAATKTLEDGDSVRIFGLTSSAGLALNDKFGLVGFDPCSGGYLVRFSAVDLPLRMKSCNVQLPAMCPRCGYQVTGGGLYAFGYGLVDETPASSLSSSPCSASSRPVVENLRPLLFGTKVVLHGLVTKKEWNLQVGTV